ncbi:alpha/beta hydrolase [Microbacterium sp.]|uniref:alpha/beta fold hydrolase n=1 Tax=Microbacterium sp. TaxID=51671 RepID=UPI002D775DA0|nr:alpha/beta hydrolase [Microbacterium sp.]HET6302970.1 alpha/beta hydrolase [Microbacterium sp.]
MADLPVHTFERGDDVVVYTRSGRSGGPVFVLVHGIGMGRGVFGDLVEELSREGEVVALDLPGFGDSPKPRRPLDMPACGGLVAALLDDLGVRDGVLVGHSMGAQVVAETLVRHPHLRGRAVLVSPTVNPAERSALLQGLRLLQDIAIESPKVLALGAIHYVKAGPVWYAKTLRRMVDHRIEDVLPQLDADTLVIRGEVDKVSPREWAREVARLVPRGVLREVPDRGHEAMIRTAQPAASLIAAHAAGTSGRPPDAGTPRGDTVEE